ncbi:MAG: ribosome maturation factor RimP [Bacillota bacterium]|nr:ribosome maturation factor RimP [Bacillota bacterium]
MQKDVLVNKLIDLIKPVVLELGYDFYHLELVKEQGEDYLRVYIDNENGISLEDCEKVSRRISDLLDIEDPITFSYYLEVSSPGIFRNLYTDEHLKRYIGYKVQVNVTKVVKGKRKFEGELISYTDLELVIKENNEEVSIERDKIRSVSLEGEL